MRKGFNFGKDLKPNYVKSIKEPAKTDPQKSRASAEHWNNVTAPAQRHVKLLNRIGRDRWLKTYQTKEFIFGIGGREEWQGLLSEMKKIIEDEK